MRKGERRWTIKELDFQGNQQTNNNMFPYLLCIEYDMHNISILILSPLDMSLN